MIPDQATIADGERQLREVKAYLHARIRALWVWALVSIMTVGVSLYVVVTFSMRIMDGGGFLYAAGGALNVIAGYLCGRSVARELAEWFYLYMLQLRIQRWLDSVRQ